MDTDAIRLAWEPPAAVPLTDTESRADRSDVWMQNGIDVSGAG
jgi:hypothetical protein